MPIKKLIMAGERGGWTIFFKIAIGETDDLSNLNLSHAKSAIKSKRADSSQEESDKPMCILILDDAHMMD